MQKQVNDNVKNNNRAGKTVYLHNTHTQTSKRCTTYISNSKTNNLTLVQTS
jgi:hypothetical protein